MLHQMQGSALREVIDGHGIKHRVVAERAGYKSSRLAKILKKTNVSTEDLEKVARALKLKPGDLLENSCGEMRPAILPLVDVLREFDDEAIPHVKSVLETLRALRKENISLPLKSDGGKMAGSVTTSAKDDGSGDAADALQRSTPIKPKPPTGTNEPRETAAKRRGRHGSAPRGKTRDTKE